MTKIAGNDGIQIADAHPNSGPVPEGLRDVIESSDPAIQQHEVGGVVLGQNRIKVPIAIQIGQGDVGEMPGRKPPVPHLERAEPIVAIQHGFAQLSHNQHVQVPIQIHIADRSALPSMERARVLWTHGLTELVDRDGA